MFFFCGIQTHPFFATHSFFFSRRTLFFSRRDALFFSRRKKTFFRVLWGMSISTGICVTGHMRTFSTNAVQHAFLNVVAPHMGDRVEWHGILFRENRASPNHGPTCNLPLNTTIPFQKLYVLNASNCRAMRRFSSQCRNDVSLQYLWIRVCFDTFDTIHTFYARVRPDLYVASMPHVRDMMAAASFVSSAKHDAPFNDQFFVMNQQLMTRFLNVHPLYFKKQEFSRVWVRLNVSVDNRIQSCIARDDEHLTCWSQSVLEQADIRASYRRHARTPGCLKVRASLRIRDAFHFLQQKLGL